MTIPFRNIYIRHSNGMISSVLYTRLRLPALLCIHGQGYNNLLFSFFLLVFFYIPQKKRTPGRFTRRLSRTYRQPYHIQPAVSYTTTVGKTARFKGLYGIVRILTHIDKQETYYKVYTPIFKFLSEEIQTLYNEIFVPKYKSIPYGIQIHTEKLLFRNSKPLLDGI